MKNAIWLFMFGLSLGFAACKGKDNAASTVKTTPLSIGETTTSKKYCVKGDKCAEISVKYPVLKGGDSLATKALNDSIQRFVRYSTQVFREKVQDEPLDSTVAGFFQEFDKINKEMPDIATGWDISVDGKVSFENEQYITVDMHEDNFLGGAHPNYSADITTYRLANAKAVAIAEFVQDTNALKPLLQKAYLADKDMKGGNLAELLYPDLKGVLPMPGCVALAAEGIRFFYNDYEVAPHAVGATEILLTWAELGKLADKNKWLATGK